jgi:hypothetical protein
MLIHNCGFILLKKKKKERKKGEKKTSLEKQHLFLGPPSRQGP